MRARTQAAEDQPGAPAAGVVPFSGSDAGWTLYEVNVEIDPAIATEFDLWLPNHVDEVLRCPGFTHADILRGNPRPDDPRKGWLRRSIQYRLTDQRHLDSYLSDHAARLRAEAQKRFGARAQFERRSLTQSTHRVPGEAHLEYCRNCGAVLGGQYCAACGQRSRVRLISLWELTKEAVGNLTDLDSRIWLTLRPLLFRPGLLTREYLAGRRTRYIPPFRLYLILSVAFFVLTSLANDDDEFVQFGDESKELSGATPERRDETQKEVDASLKEASQKLRDAGVLAPGQEIGDVAPQLNVQVPAAPAEKDKPSTSDEESRGEEASAGDKKDSMSFCEEAQFDLGTPSDSAIEQRMREACRKIAADHGDQFSRALFANIPKMMFVFLPLLALVNKVLYPFSRRYYVEHLLFFVHYHAFVFLLFSLQGLFALSTRPITTLEWARQILVLVIIFYLPIYLYKAMRRVYGQGRLLTILKFMFLFIAYFVSLLLTLVGIVVYTALTL
jgi:hypothetical protein